MRTILNALVVLAAFGAFALPTAAAAQSGAPAPAPGTITVAGRGTSSVVPDRLRVVVRLTPRSAAGDQLLTLATSVVDAMHAGGIADAKIVFPIAGNLGSTTTVAVVGTVTDPTRESVEAIARATLKAIPDATATALQNGYQVQGAYTASDCSEGDARAQAAAIADARARAQRVAAASGLHLGPIVSVSEAASFASAACGPAENPGTFGSNLDPYGSIAIPINVSATVVFGAR